LRVVGVFGAIIGHCNDPAVSKAQTRVDFVLKWLYSPQSGAREKMKEGHTAIDGFPSTARSSLVARLDEKSRDDPDRSGQSWTP
jgi:hypothetical protein